MHPSPLRRSVGTVLPRAFGGELEVLAELFVTGLRSELHHVFTQLVPVEVEGERVEQQCFRDQVMQHKHADLFEQVGEEDVIVCLESLLKEAPEGGTGRLAMK